jgi:hypothetical protein
LDCLTGAFNFFSISFLIKGQTTCACASSLDFGFAEGLWFCRSSFQVLSSFVVNCRVPEILRKLTLGNLKKCWSYLNACNKPIGKLPCHKGGPFTNSSIENNLTWRSQQLHNGLHKSNGDPLSTPEHEIALRLHLQTVRKGYHIFHC